MFSIGSCPGAARPRRSRPRPGGVADAVVDGDDREALFARRAGDPSRAGSRCRRARRLRRRRPGGRSGAAAELVGSRVVGAEQPAAIRASAEHAGCARTTPHGPNSPAGLPAAPLAGALDRCGGDRRWFRRRCVFDGAGLRFRAGVAAGSTFGSGSGACSGGGRRGVRRRLGQRCRARGSTPVPASHSAATVGSIWRSRTGALRCCSVDHQRDRDHAGRHAGGGAAGRADADRQRPWPGRPSRRRGCRPTPRPARAPSRDGPAAAEASGEAGERVVGALEQGAAERQRRQPAPPPPRARPGRRAGSPGSWRRRAGARAGVAASSAPASPSQKAESSGRSSSQRLPSSTAREDSCGTAPCPRPGSG